MTEKLTGAALLLGCGLWWGFSAAGSLRRRERDLGAWLAALTLLEGELSFAFSDLPSLLETLSRRAPGPADQVFAAALRSLDRLGERPFADLWAQALADHPGALAPQDLEPLSRLGVFLGRYGREDQSSAAAQVRSLLAQNRLQAREDLERKGRAYTATGFALAAFLTLLLL